MDKRCRFCGLVGPVVCDGIGPRMGCDMPGLHPGYVAPADAEKLARAQVNGDSPASDMPPYERP